MTMWMDKHCRVVPGAPPDWKGGGVICMANNVLLLWARRNLEYSAGISDKICDPQGRLNPARGREEDARCDLEVGTACQQT